MNKIWFVQQSISRQVEAQIKEWIWAPILVGTYQKVWLRVSDEPEIEEHVKNAIQDQITP